MKPKQQGFTLIELMIVVSIIGILSSIAIPSFEQYSRKAKTAEVTSNLNLLFKGAVSYYNVERSRTAGVRFTANRMPGHCTVRRTNRTPTRPTASKQTVDFLSNASFRDLNFAIGDQVYFAYQVLSQNQCNVQANNTNVYTFRAFGDLDGDRRMSTYELAVGSNTDNLLYHAPGFYVVDELE